MFLNLINSSLSKGDLQEVGIAGFTAYVTLDDSVTRKATVPTNYLEDGSFAADHIINEPKTISINGSVSDTYIRLSPLHNIVNSVNNQLGQIDIYADNMTTTQRQKMNALVNETLDNINYIDSAIKSGNQVFDYFGNRASSNSLTRQFIDTMVALHESKQLISISLAHETLTNMCITDFTHRSDNKSNAISFTLAAQEVRIAQTIYVETDAYYKNPSKAVADQVKENSPKGVQERKKAVVGLGLSGYLIGYFL